MGVPAVRVIDQKGKVTLDPDAILKALKDNAADARRAMTGNTGAVRTWRSHSPGTPYSRPTNAPTVDGSPPDGYPEIYSGPVISGKACIIARQASECDNGSSQPTTKDVAAVDQVLDRFVQIRESALRVGAWITESANGASE